MKHKALACAALLAFGLPGCGGPGDADLQEFLDLPPVEGPGPDIAPSASAIARAISQDDPRRFASRALDVDFADGRIPRGWRFRRTRGRPVVEGGSLRVELGTAGVRSQLVWGVNIPAAAVTHLLFRVGPISRELAREELRVYWLAQGQTNFGQRRLLFVPWDQVRDGLLLIELGSHPEWKGRIERLRLDLGRAGALQIESVRSLHLADFLSIADEDTSALMATNVEIRRMRRPALRVSPTSELRQRVMVAAGQTLVFGFALHPDTAYLPTSVTQFEVSVTDDGETQTLLSVEVPGEQAPLGAGWLDVSIDLALFSGRDVILALSTKPAKDRGGAATGVPLWSEPRLTRVASGARLPNLLLIVVDTLRADHLQSYGYERATSPALSRFAEQGVRFAECIAHAPSTLPSHGALFTGIPAHKSRIHAKGGLRLPPSRLTLAEILREQGFATAAIAGGAYLDPYFGLSQGFETYAYAKLEDRADSFVYSDIETNTVLALRWLEQNRDRRFFLFFHTYQVHSPYDPRQPWLNEFLPEGVSPPGASISVAGNGRYAQLEPPDYAGWRDYIHLPNPGPDFTEPDLERILAAYDSEIRVTDGHVGRLLDALERYGLADDTVVVFTSDHGEAFLEHGRTEHGHLYAHNLNVPLMLRYPGRLPAGRVIRERVQLVDVVPTSLELLGVEIPDTVEGVSLVGSMIGDESPPRRSVVSYNHVSGMSYITADGGKLIANFLARHPNAGRKEYFDLSLDPNELRDRFAELTPEEARALLAEMDAAVSELPGTHLVLVPDRPARFIGTIALEGSHSSLADQLRAFPLEPGWISFRESRERAEIETGTFDQWRILTHAGRGELSLRGRVIAEDGGQVEIDERFQLDEVPLASLPPEARVRSAREGNLELTLRATLVDPFAGAAPVIESPSHETLRQLEGLGYLE